MHCRGYCEYTRTMKYARTSAICAPCRSFHVHCLKKIFTDGPTSGSWIKLNSAGATGILRALAVIREYILWVFAILQGSVLRILPVLQLFRWSILRVLPVLGVLYCSYSQYSQYLGLQYCSYSQYSAVFRPPVLQYSQQSEYEMYSIIWSMLFV